MNSYMFVLPQKISLILIIVLIILSFFAFFSNYKNSSNNIRAGDNSVLSLREAALKIEDTKKIPHYKDIVLEKIYLDNNNAVYSLKNGEVFEDGIRLNQERDNEKIDRVLRLVLFYQWMKEDPLFFSTSLNADEFEEAVNRFRKEQETAFKLFPKLSNNILPLDFLRDFTDSSRNYQVFSNYISEENARQLLERIKMTSESYFNDVVSLKDTVIKIVGNDSTGATKLMIDEKTFTNTKIFLDDLDKIGENSRLNEKEIDERQKCLFDSPEFCKRPLIGLSRPKKIVGNDENIPIFLPKERLFLSDGLSYHGPYKINFSCLGVGVEQYMYYSNEGYLKDLRYFTIDTQLATDIYFIRVNDYLSTDKYWRAKGLAVKPQNVVNPYICIDLGYIPKLATLNYFYNEFKDKKLFSDYGEKNETTELSDYLRIIMEKGREAENDFFNSKYPGEKELYYLGNYYGFAYAYMANNNTQNAETKENFLKRYLIIKEKMMDSDLILNQITRYFSEFVDNINKGGGSISEDYVYTIRSGYSFSFLNFSNTIWRNAEKPQYFKTSRDVLSEKRLRKEIFNYQEAISEFGEDNIIKWIDIFREDKEKKLISNSF